MFSSIKKAFSSFFYGNDDSDDDSNENEEDLIKRIENHDILNIELPHQEEVNDNSEPKQPEVDLPVYKCFHKSGKITYLSPDYGLIDGTQYFDNSHVPETVSIKVGDMVSYLCYQATENQTERIQRIYACQEDSWELDALENQTSGVQKTEEVLAFDRIVNGQITQRKERECFVEPANVWCNLDNIETSFVPIEGMIYQFPGKHMNLQSIYICQFSCCR